ncbi:MAG TPA: ATP-dependent DNA ligase [Opitutaceae bacterium]|nr:ATP-dependent DNA ligase [Opitutaceae bacterium]
MAFLLAASLAPMEATSVSEIPRGDAWQYEPKWDGFRCLAFRSGKEVELRSKSGQSLSRYFPEIVAAVGKLSAKEFVLDGEIVIPAEGGLSFDALLQRIHPAESRVRKLASETPGWFIVFDLLATKADGDLTEAPLQKRRAKLEAFAKKNFDAKGALRLSPATRKISQAEKWFGAGGSTLDGLIAKNLEAPYASGKRDAMVKIKPQRTADCVVGGFRYAEKKKVVGSLLLGLYDEEGKLNHVGFCSGLKTTERAALTKKLEQLIEPPGFTGKAPGGPSRWSTERSAEWKPLKPKLVVEVSFDHVTGDRFRHGTGLVRWRPDKSPRQCTMDQMLQKRSTSLARLLGARK